MKKKLGPFRIFDKDGYLIWEGELKEITFEDDHGRRWTGKIVQEQSTTGIIKPRFRRGRQTRDQLKKAPKIFS